MLLTTALPAPPLLCRAVPVGPQAVIPRTAATAAAVTAARPVPPPMFMTPPVLCGDASAGTPLQGATANGSRGFCR
ncbi:hypothetical protein GCM10011578_002730 [Streptomyces fuscichromogenes]|uniref:Uncharacterized protein n=1 Tax=Streptomyces fuscichromogenes TaxID=1324013 RepID=A0A917UEE8_9ACTN|nr:hypothetical protein GCM10011578_002730 [Streptomyces fuscichromogenes]